MKSKTLFTAFCAIAALAVSGVSSAGIGPCNNHSYLHCFKPADWNNRNSDYEEIVYRVPQERSHGNCVPIPGRVSGAQNSCVNAGGTCNKPGGTCTNVTNKDA
ncbi:hypothetical protein [Candidatus Hydrogenosomobacter endosymbioticus]|uniref:Uncharacterized protein n=1 Tax=Candidatus Hydrogenosomobacter endosymbioticus TaxID=2558174 RepID=A0ABN6L794_9PROT|nr:hypothetical protein [Candidatus Hydrogenosomobacter endosymbioticus]BDB96047.1 hypothetical protein HYD_1800 [Candidatus Hydrogenosomobacter endosymbioticus]